MSLKIETLRMFCLLAEKLSFTDAAEAMQMTQPTLSRKISQLEKEINIRLFHRGGSHIHLTPQGAVFYESCLRLLQGFEDTVDALNDTSDNVRGEICVGVLHPMAVQLSKRFLKGFFERYPNIRIHLTTLHPKSLKNIRDCDIMISPVLPEDESLVAKPLKHYRRVYCASPEFLGQHGEPQHPRELEEYDCITNTNALRPEHFWCWQDEDGNTGQVEVRGVVSTDSVDVSINLAIEGLGIALLPDARIRDHINNGELKVLFDGKYGQCGQMYAVYRSRQYLPVRYQVFMEELRQFMSEKLV